MKIASQSVAGHPVAWVNNQFQQYVYDVTDLIHSPVSHDTNITVAFESAWYYGLNVTSRPDAEASPTGNVSFSPYNAYNGLTLNAKLLEFEYAGVRQYIRKTQSDFGWDWVSTLCKVYAHILTSVHFSKGPAFVPSGIFKPAYLVTLSSETSTKTTAPASHPLLVETTTRSADPRASCP